MYCIEIFNRAFIGDFGQPQIGRSKKVMTIEGEDRDRLAEEARKLCVKFDADVFLRGSIQTAKQWELKRRKHEWRFV